MLVFRGYPEAAATPVVLTIGNFDGVHLGHQALLRRLCERAEAAELPAAVLTFEPHPREFFSPQTAPTRLSSLREKLDLLAFYGVDRAHVVRFHRGFAALSADAFVEQVLVRGLGVRHLLIGDDFRFGARRVGDFKLLQQQGNKQGFAVEAMASVTHADGVRVSSSEVRGALAAGDLPRARALLGRDYVIAGRVQHGDQLGRQLGFRTANVQLKHNRPPLTGVFAVEVRGLEGAPRPGVANLGVRPTATSAGRAVLEVHLFDFEADIYDAHLEVVFLQKIRDEKKFSGLDALRGQIALDAVAARAFHASRQT